MPFDATARTLGMASASATVLLQLLYLGVLVAGLMALETPQQPIPDPYFTALEALILLMVPALIALMVAVHAWAPTEMKAFSLIALAFTGILAGLTAGVHFTVLTLGRHPAFADYGLLFSFTWPSLAYALDILAWDVFFALATLSAAPVFRGSRLAALARVLLIASGVTAFSGLAGVAAGDMQLRNIGIVGYAGIFPLAAAVLAIVFRRTPAREGRDR